MLIIQHLNTGSHLSALLLVYNSHSSLFTSSSMPGWSIHTDHAPKSSAVWAHTWISRDSKACLVLVAQVLKQSSQKSNFSDNFTSHFFRPLFPLTVTTASAHLRKYDPNLSNHETRKMKFMTMTKGEEHKQKASKKTYRTDYSSVKIASNSLKYRLLFFFPPSL